MNAESNSPTPQNQRTSDMKPRTTATTAPATQPQTNNQADRRFGTPHSPHFTHAGRGMRGVAYSNDGGGFVCSCCMSGNPVQVSFHSTPQFAQSGSPNSRTSNAPLGTELNQPERIQSNPTGPI